MGMATHSSIFAWEIPWTEEPGGLQSMGSQRVRHIWVTLRVSECIYINATFSICPSLSFPRRVHKSIPYICISISFSNACMHAKSLLLCPTLCDPTDSSPPGWLLCPWDSPGKNTGVGCHFLLPYSLLQKSIGFCARSLLVVYFMYRSVHKLILNS